MPSEKLFAKITISSILLISILVIAMSCKECPTEPEYDISLSVEDIACVWVTFNVILPDSGKINTFTLERNDSTVATYTCYDDDTLIIDDGLTPDNDYSYTVCFLKDNKTKATSDPVSIHTLSTTSNDFVWEIDTLGNYGSYLKDAWIVDENNIWVVGYLRVDDPDSSFDGTGQETFNAARWDSDKWNLFRFERGAPLISIWYFNENDIWATGGVPIHWDGEKWKFYHLWNMGILDNNDGGVEHIWASSPDDIYFVGRNGSIVHYNGSTFSKMNSGTEINLEDVYGIGSHVFATGSEYEDEYSGQSVAMHGRNGQWKTVRHEYAFYPQKSTDWGKICSSWAYEKYAYYIAYSGLMRYDPENSNLEECFSINEMNTYHLNIIKIKGNALNDIIHVNNWAHIVHYNGETWLPIEDVFNQYPDGGIDVEGMDFKGDVVAIVGFTRYYSHAAVVRGHR